MCRMIVIRAFMPMVAELPLAMLACARMRMMMMMMMMMRRRMIVLVCGGRIGAVHSVVFAGFSQEALAGRLLDAGEL
jgi:acyl-coenzyme A synthetase/AMP-(fatty) acid ligase